LSYSLTAKKLRLPLGFVLAAFYLWYTPNTMTTGLTVAVGALIALVGLGVRAWASGHIMKNDRLATTGPYAHTRNPLYFGSFLLGAGFAVASDFRLLLLVIAFWVLVYGPTMQREKANISSRFPDAYADYQTNVPAFVPRPTPWRQDRTDGDTPFSLALYMKHSEWQAALGYAGVLAWIVVRMARGW
jgi:protein-S-isoprenylcysteine O-methyltransferase Ste14